MKGIKKLLEKIEASSGLINLPDFEKMTPKQMEAWFTNATEEE